MLTFEVDPAGEVEVNFDAAGREQLLFVLQRIALGDHDHLFTPSWGGDQMPEHVTLSEQFPNPDLVPVHKVTFQFIQRSKTG